MRCRFCNAPNTAGATVCRVCAAPFGVAINPPRPEAPPPATAAPLFLRSLRGHGGRVAAIAAKDTMLATAHEDGAVRVWDLDSGNQRHTLRLKAPGPVRAIVFAPAVAMAVSGHEDGAVRLWDAERGELLGTLSGHAGAVDALAVAPDGTMIASAGLDSTIILWEITWPDLAMKGEVAVLRELERGLEAVTGLAFSPDGWLLASVDDGGAVSAWNARGGYLAWTAKSGSDRLTSVTFARDDRLLAGAHDGIHIWQGRTGQRGAHFPDDGISALAMSSDGVIASGSTDGVVCLRHFTSGRLLHTLPNHGKEIAAVIFPRHGCLASAAGEEVWLWQV